MCRRALLRAPESLSHQCPRTTNGEGRGRRRRIPLQSVQRRASLPAGKSNKTIGGIARQLFYWISLLVVTLVAALTVMESFGVYLFPHHSWSEGIDAKVIQGPGGALFYTYESVKPSDLRFQFPAGVQPAFVVVLADINPTDARAKLFLRLMTLPEDLFFLVLVWL